MIQFARMHGSGNDFVVVDDRAGRLRAHRQKLARAACDRRQGLGGDGLLLLSTSENGHVVMDYMNADGNDADMCGNGAACAIRRAWELGFFAGLDTILDTSAGEIAAHLSGFHVTMHMTDPKNERLHLAVPTSEGTLTGHFIDTGVPHLVLFVADAAKVNLEELGPEIRHHPMFPSGCNVNWASPVDLNAFRMRTFERGVEGETWSCGTGATAIALLAHRLGLAKAPIEIRASGGGTLRIELDEAPNGALRNVRTTVEVERIAEGTIDQDWLARRGLDL